MKKVLITTTSLQDTPGEHQILLQESGWEITSARGPLSEEEIYNLVGEYDGIICGDDFYSRRVLEKAKPKLQFLSKYGIGLDKIDIDAATALNIPVLYTPGVNHTTVAEHTFLLMLMLVKQAPFHVQATKNGQWSRQTGNEICDKTLGIIGLGRIGQEVAKRAKAFGLNVIAYGNYWDEAFAEEHQVKRAQSLNEIWASADFISLHTKLTEKTKFMINKDTISQMKEDVFIINCARGEIVQNTDLINALDNGKLKGYASDVLDQEPPEPNHPLLKHEKVIITPHIGSRTFESVQRQATKAIQNLQLCFEGKEPLAQIN